MWGVLHPSLVLLPQYLVDSGQKLLLRSSESSLIDGPRCAIRHDRPKFSKTITILTIITTPSIIPSGPKSQ
jgi:hypothetical protein